MRILLTRVQEENERLKAILLARGHQPVCSPLMLLRIYDGPELALESVQGVLATSANGVRALAARTRRRDVPVFAVGPHTAEVAAAGGFRNIRHSDQDSATLADAVCRWANPRDGALLHIAGREHGSALAQTLTRNGFNLTVERLYAADACPLSAEAVRAIANGQADAAMVFSPRSGRLLVEEMARLQLQPHGTRIKALCISPAAADAVGELPFASLHVAPQPNLESMLGLLDQL